MDGVLWLSVNGESGHLKLHAHVIDRDEGLKAVGSHHHRRLAAKH